MSEMSPEEVAERLEKAITDGMQFTASDFPPHPDGRRFHVREFGREWQVHGLGLAHVCMCSSVRMADIVAEALEKLSREQVQAEYERWLRVGRFADKERTE